MNHPRLIAAAWLLAGLSACSAFATPTPTPTIVPPTATSTLTPTPTLTPTVTPLGCLTEAGDVVQGQLDNQKPPQEFIIYLPPCYAEKPDKRYPVLYLLHGQTYQDDQWVKLGAPTIADTLIHSGQAQPFIMVFPDDRYWNLPPGERFVVSEMSDRHVCVDEYDVAAQVARYTHGGDHLELFRVLRHGGDIVDGNRIFPKNVKHRPVKRRCDSVRHAVLSPSTPVFSFGRQVILSDFCNNLLEYRTILK